MSTPEEIEGSSRPVSTRVPSQVGVRAAFSRPVTAAVLEENDSEFEEDDDIAIDEVLITQLKEAVADPPPSYPIWRPLEEDLGYYGGKTPDIFNPEQWDTDLDDSEDDEDLEDPTFRRLYLDICQRLGVIPVSYFISHIDDDSVSLKHHGLSACETTAIAHALKKILKIEKLDLEGNYMSSKGCKYLCQVLEDNHCIKELSLAENQLGNSSVPHLCSMLAHNGTLKKLSLANNSFTDKSAPLLAESLEDCKLIDLSLSGNHFGDKGGQIIGPAVGTNVYLDSLDLSWNQIRCGGATAIAKGLKENVRLSVLDLSWNGFGEDGGLALADALVFNTNLKELDISSNRLTLAVAVRMAKTLSSNEVLEVLKMANNPISTSGCLTLVEMLNKSQTSILRYLDLYENPVEYEFLRVAKDIHTKKPDFQIYHGPILRAGNTDQDIGKPSIDIVRMSQKHVMILKGELHINNPIKFREIMKKRRIRTEKLTPDQLIACVQDLDSTLSNKSVTDAVTKVSKDDDNLIPLSELLKPGESTHKTAQ